MIIINLFQLLFIFFIYLFPVHDFASYIAYPEATREHSSKKLEGFRLYYGEKSQR